jgi:hypothetical protein
MKKIVILALSLTLVGSAGYATGTASGAGGSRYLAASILANAGSISGQVLCGEESMMMEGSSGPRPWSTVWVQGHSFSAKTDGDGNFVIDYVPPGTYTLGVQTAGNPIRAEVENVVVRPQRTTTLDEPIQVVGGCGECGGGGGGHEPGGEPGGCEGEEGGCEGGSGTP